MARSELTQDTDFYIATNGVDTPGNGLSPSTPWLTRAYAWDQLCDNYDLRGKRAIINLAPGTYTDDFFAHGSPPGSRSFGQIAPYGSNPRPLDKTKQIVFRGDVANPSNVMIRPTNGPSFFLENGAAFCVEGFTLDHSSPSHWESMMGASAWSVLMLGKNIIGPAPGQVEIQIGFNAACFIYDSYTIDHTIGGQGGGGSSTNSNAAVGPASGYMGLASPNPAIVPGMTITGPGLQPGTTVVSYNGVCDVTFTPTQANNVGFASYTFSTGGGGGGGVSGPSLFHIQQDAASMVHFETDDGITPHITIEAKNTPAYSTFVKVDGGDMILREGPQIPGVTFKGSVSGQNVSLSRGGYIFNTPNDNQIVWTP